MVSNNWVCDCPVGRTGKDCRTIDPTTAALCNPNPCKNGGVCSIIGSSKKVALNRTLKLPNSPIPILYNVQKQPAVVRTVGPVNFATRLPIQWSIATLALIHALTARLAIRTTTGAIVHRHSLEPFVKLSVRPVCQFGHDQI